MAVFSLKWLKLVKISVWYPGSPMKPIEIWPSASIQYPVAWRSGVVAYWLTGLCGNEGNPVEKPVSRWPCSIVTLWWEPIQWLLHDDLIFLTDWPEVTWPGMMSRGGPLSTILGIVADWSICRNVMWRYGEVMMKSVFLWRVCVVLPHSICWYLS